MLDFLSQERALIAAFIIFALFISLGVSIYVGVKQSALRAKDEVFGDPERTKGGWYWALCGISALLLIWFYFSWGIGRAYFPDAGNEMCQSAKIDEAISPITAALPMKSRYYKSTTLVVRNVEQLADKEARLPVDAFSTAEQRRLLTVIDQTRTIISAFSNPENQNPESFASLERIAVDLDRVTAQINAGYQGMQPSAKALSQPKWGVAEEEIPLLPMTAKGVLFDLAAGEIKEISKAFLKLRNKSDEADQLIIQTKADIAGLKQAIKQSTGDDRIDKLRAAYVKSVERIYKRVDDGTIFPADALNTVNASVNQLYQAVESAKGSLSFVETVFFPGQGVVKSKTICSEQGPGRWLPKPTDVVATFGKLANPDIESGGGYKGTTLLWWKWLPVADVVAFLIPDGLVDMLPGDYARHQSDGSFVPNYKDNLLAVAQGNIWLGSIPMLDGHIWDSLFRVIVAMGFGILLGVPLGIYMGVSRFFKSFFDPLIELYRPVPPLAWAPLILTIFGIQDDGKIFLLFMVAFAIMVISARTGASGTQLSKIRASHSLGATDRQILRHVILPNAMPEILTGIRIAIGVCWGTLVAAEMLAGTTGVGFIENVARTVSDYELIWVTILIMGVLGLIFDLIMRWVISKTIPWRGKG